MQIKHLSKHDAVSLLETIHQCALCDREDDLRKIINKLGEIISFEFSLSFIGIVDSRGMKKPSEFINFSFPGEMMEYYLLNREYLIDPIAKRNFASYQLQYWADTLKGYEHPTDFRSLMIDFGVVHGYTHGTRNFRGNIGSGFSFAGRKIERSKRTEMIIELVGPHLHQALGRIADLNTQSSYTGGVLLSSRETEVLKWLKHGKSTWDISQILSISDRTVKFHIGNVMRKLDASTRAHAVAIAIEQGQVGIE